MEYNVFVYDVVADKVVVRNLFELSGRFAQGLNGLQRTEAFEEDLRRLVSYAFRGKSEYEIMQSGLFCRVARRRLEEELQESENQPYFVFNYEGSVKVDVYDQVCMNWGIFYKYVCENWESYVKAKKKKSK